MRAIALLERWAALLEAPLRWIGAVLVPLVLAIVLLQCAAVLLRYGFGYSQPWLREGVLAANAMVFLLGAAFALMHDEHVRVDVLSRRLSPRVRAGVECVGMLLTVLPFALFVIVISQPYVLTSFQIGERSAEPGGLPFLWLQKALIPAMALLLIVAALARAARAAAQWLRLGDGALPDSPA